MTSTSAVADVGMSDETYQLNAILWLDPPATGAELIATVTALAPALGGYLANIPGLARAGRRSDAYAEGWRRLEQTARARTLAVARREAEAAGVDLSPDSGLPVQNIDEGVGF